MNEPVAWMEKWFGGDVGDQYEFHLINPTNNPYWIPLYTHPANPYQSITDTKIEPTVVSYTHPAELTDEEIWKCHDETDSDNWVIDFARAILKRAQEK